MTAASTLAKIDAFRAGVAGFGGAPAVSDFDVRKNAPGVVRACDFDSAAQLAWANANSAGRYKPVLDTAVKCSGVSSLRFDIVNENPGTFMADFSDDFSKRFGENSEHYIQVRVRWNDVMAETLFRQVGGNPQGGIKLFDTGAGDYVLPGGSIKRYYSDTDLKLVVQTYYQHRNPIVYRYWQGGNKTFEEFLPPYDYKLQNAMTACLYSAGGAVAPGADIPGCWSMVANEWLTFQLGTTRGAKGTYQGIPVWLDSTVRLWAARENKPSTLLLDWKPGVNGYVPLWRGDEGDEQQYGKVCLFPYMTNKDSTQVHGLGQVWYDELIVSTQRIADPA